MTQERVHADEYVWPALVVAVLLAGITGFVDAVAFDRFLGVFPANQSGNAVFLGMAIGGSSVSTVWRPATAMVGFALGIVVGQLVRQRVHGPRLGAWLLVCELALFVSVIVIKGGVAHGAAARGARGRRAPPRARGVRGRRRARRHRAGRVAVAVGALAVLWFVAPAGVVTPRADD